MDTAGNIYVAGCYDILSDASVDYDWHAMKWQEAGADSPVDEPGSKVWNYRAYETDYYAVPSASPFIRLHMGRPQLEGVKNMTALYPELPQSARKDLRAKMDKIVAALAPYGAKKLPAGPPPTMAILEPVSILKEYLLICRQPSAG